MSEAAMPGEVAIAMDAAMDAHFRQPMARPTIAETAAYYRQRRMLAVILHRPNAEPVLQLIGACGHMSPMEQPAAVPARVGTVAGALR